MKVEHLKPCIFVRVGDGSVQRGRDTEAADKFLLELERSQKIFEYDLAALEKQQ